MKLIGNHRKSNSPTDSINILILVSSNTKFVVVCFVCQVRVESFVSLKIHWFSIFNSFMMVLFLVGLVSMILLRTLKKDYARYSKDDDLDDMV